MPSFQRYRDGYKLPLDVGFQHTGLAAPAS